jgi:hypothetical protein
MPLTTGSEEKPVKIVGSSVFGRYPTISVERTYNLFVTTSGDGAEEWLVNFPGYRIILQMFANDIEGRGAFHSVRGGFLLVVVSGAVFRINLLSELPIQIGTIDSTSGEVFMDENLSSQICIVAGGRAYIYNYAAATTSISPAVYNNVPFDTLFRPNYVTYHNTYFLFGNALTTNSGSQWVIFEQNTTVGDYNLNWVQTLALQTKPDFAKAILRIPGKGNNVIVFGSTVAEIWSNVGGLAVYQRNSSINIDFGAASVATIAANEEVVAWLGINEHSTPALMAMKGGAAARISTDGLDHLLSRVNFPSESTAVLFRQDGHNFYILTFIHQSDNFSIVYDFTTDKIYDVTDWNGTAFPARQIVYFNSQALFINYKDGKIYELSTDITTYDFYDHANPEMPLISYEIPRKRVTNTYRLPRPEKYKINMFTFVIESGTTHGAYNQPTCFGYILTEDTDLIIYTEDGLPILVEGGYCFINKPRVDLTISKNGGNTFSNAVQYILKATGDFKNQPRFNNLGYAQQITYQLEFWSRGRVVVKNGTMEIGA